MVFGVFDLLHPGHVNFLKQAKKEGSFLIVSVARDKNVKKTKGRLPVFNEKKRLEILKKLKLADKVILAGLTDPWPHIQKEKPEIIALGYDQRSYINKQITNNKKQEKLLETELRKHGLKTKVVRLKPFRPNVFKSSKLRSS